MEEKLGYVIIAFVLAEGINVFACWNPTPFNLEGVDLAQLKKGEKAAGLFTLSYGGIASIVTKNPLPFIVSLLFVLAMVVLYEHEWASQNARKEVAENGN